MSQSRYAGVLVFILGFGLFIFTRLSKLVPTIPVAMLVSFVFILRFSRTQPAKKGIWLTLLGFLISINIGLWGLFDLGGETSTLVFNVIRSSLLGILYFLPFMIDRLVYPRLKDDSLLSTLVFPTITTAVFYLLTIEGPFEGMIQPDKFVFGPTVFLQIISLFGVFGFVFVTSWFASAINHMWDVKFDWQKSKIVAIALASVVCFMFIFGFIKTSSHFEANHETVKVAGIIAHPKDYDVVPVAEMMKAKQASPLEECLSEIELLVNKAAENEAKIVVFQEFAIIIDEDDRGFLHKELSRLAVENDVYLAIGYAYYANVGKGENKMVMVDNQGDFVIDYTKRYLVGIGNTGEPAVFKKGPDKLQYADTPYGKVTVSVCRDMEMAKYIIQAGKAGVDIMLSVAYEWPKTWNMSMQNRAIENGFSLVRVAYNGVSHSHDYNGRVLNQMSFDDSQSGIMYTEIPTKGIRTLYPNIGHLIGQLSVFGFLFLVFRSRKNERPE